MKNNSLNHETVTTNENQSGQTQSSELSSSQLPFAEVDVYFEMQDRTQIKLNLLEQIHQQFEQLETLVAKNRFLLKEVSDEVDYFKKS